MVPTITSKGLSPNKDTAKVIKREGSVFNEFVRPEEGAIFDSHATAIHGLTAEHENIVNAADIETVWDQFCRWFYIHLRDDEVAVLVAWNGETCDLKWLWKLTQAPRSPCYFPDEMIYFMDPMKTLQHYKSCKLNHSHSKLDSYELGVVWSHVHGGANLNGAHDSLVDARAQTDIIIDECYVPFLNKSASIHPIDEIFTKREQNEMKKKMEPIRPVHLPWIEISKDNDVKWAPDGADKYDSSGGGGAAGPSSAMLEIARTAKSLADIFMFMVPFSFFE